MAGLPAFALDNYLAPSSVQQQIDAAMGCGAAELLDHIAMRAVCLADESLEVLPRQSSERLESSSRIKQSSPTITDEGRGTGDKYKGQRENPRYAVQQYPLDPDVDEEGKN